MIQGEKRGFQIVQRRVDGLYIVEDMPLGDEQVFLPVIVEVLQANAPARGYSGKHGHSSLQAAVAEHSVAIVMKDGVRLAWQSCDNHVGLAVIIVILKYHAHAGQRSAVKVER